MGWTNQSANPNSCCCPEDLFPVPAACSLQPHLVSPQFRRLSQLPLGSLPCSSLILLEVASVSFSCFSWRSTKILKHVIAGSRFTVTCHLMIHFYMIMWVFHCQLRLLEGKIVFFSWLSPPITSPWTGTETWHFSLVNLSVRRSVDPGEGLDPGHSHCHDGPKPGSGLVVADDHDFRFNSFWSQSSNLWYFIAIVLLSNGYFMGILW